MEEYLKLSNGKTEKSEKDLAVDKLWKTKDVYIYLNFFILIYSIL
jgi:hypothetical protein